MNAEDANALDSLCEKADHITNTLKGMRETRNILDISDIMIKLNETDSKADYFEFHVPEVFKILSKWKPTSEPDYVFSDWKWYKYVLLLGDPNTTTGIKNHEKHWVLFFVSFGLPLYITLWMFLAGIGKVAWDEKSYDIFKLATIMPFIAMLKEVPPSFMQSRLPSVICVPGTMLSVYLLLNRQVTGWSAFFLLLSYFSFAVTFAFFRVAVLVSRKVTWKCRVKNVKEQAKSIIDQLQRTNQNMNKTSTLMQAKPVENNDDAEENDDIEQQTQ